MKQAGGNNETICALKDVDGDQSLPPVGDFFNNWLSTIRPLQGECDGELWRRNWRAGLESGGSEAPLGSPVPDAWILLGLSFKWVTLSLHVTM